VNLTGIFQWNYGSESLRRMSSVENGKRGSEGDVETLQRKSNKCHSGRRRWRVHELFFFNKEATKLLYADGNYSSERETLIL